MAATFVITQGNTAPALAVICKDASGAAVPLTSASGVTFTARDSGSGTIAINAEAATIESPASQGVVTYAWQAGDTDVVRTLLGKFTVTWGDGTSTSFPTNSAAGENYITISVVDDAATVD